METTTNMHQSVEVNSETGKLEGVILHFPGPEVENMTPKTVEKALYSDILNLDVARSEYNEFKLVLEKATKTYQVKELLHDILTKDSVKNDMVTHICRSEDLDDLRDGLLDMDATALSTALIEGIELKRDNLTRFLSKDWYSLEPLHNFFFTRDASISFGNQVLISQMASKVRERETIIMEAIFQNHPDFMARTCDPGINHKDFYFEGGDFLVIREDILCVGTGLRTSTAAIDFLISKFVNERKDMNIVVQELPYKPESFIHLDMAFTMIDRDACMIFEPLITQQNRYLTILIKIRNGKVHIEERPNIPAVLRELGMDLKILRCGGSKDIMVQEREQWHSGANFFALEPGKVMGYSRNIYTIEEMNDNGFEVLRAKDIIAGEVSIDDYKKCVITIDGAELSRGGGGCRCMTMPVKRASTD